MMEEKRLRWAGRPSKPVGAARRLRVGSTPALFRRSVACVPSLLPNGNTVPENLYTPSLYALPLRYGWLSERAHLSPDDTRERRWRR